MKIPQTNIHFGSAYRHCDLSHRRYVPVSSTSGMILVNNMTAQSQEYIPDTQFLNGTFIRIPEKPKGVMWLSFDYWWLNGAFAILNDKSAIFWHGPIVTDMVNTCFETQVSDAILKEHPELFKNNNLFNHFSQLFGILKDLGVNMKGAKAHNYTHLELEEALKSGKLKPFPGQKTDVCANEKTDFCNTLEMNAQGAANERPTIVENAQNTANIPQQLSLF